MHTNISARTRKILLGSLFGGIILIFCFLGNGSPIARAQEIQTPGPNPYYTVDTLALPDGMLIEKHAINGPILPPPGFETERQTVDVSTSSARIIDNVPAYTWTLGCSAGADGMIAAFNDKLHPNLFPGDTPLNDSAMETVTDVHGDSYKLNPVVLSRAAFRDYWVCYESGAPDPYTGYAGGCAVPAPRPIGDDLTGQAAGWPQHAWGDTIGDFMYTSQSAFDNIDGQTQFYIYANSANRFTCDVMSSRSLPDGSLGTKLFYETRGYAVGDCYNQPTDNTRTGGFSFAQYKAEIDAGRPVMLHLEGHSIVGIGYDDSTKTVYIHDGWDYGTYSIPWGGSYFGMRMQMVSIVNIIPGVPDSYTISGNAGAANAAITYTSGFTTTNASGDYSFTVPAGWFGTVTPSRPGYTFTPPSLSYANILANQVAQDYTTVQISHTLSGNAGMAGAILSYIDGTSKTVVADANGNYSITVPYGWSGTVTPSDPCFIFTPDSQVYGDVTENLTDQNYTTAPGICVSAITRANSSPTGLASVDFTVTFTKSATGVDAGDFALTTSGVSGTGITGVAGSGASYTVSVNTGSGNGTIRLDLVDDDTIRDASNHLLGGTGKGNGDFTSGETYSMVTNLSQPALSLPRTNYTMNDSTPGFSWNAVANAQYYKILFATDMAFTQNTNSHIVTPPSFIFSPPLADGKYYWRVQAYDARNSFSSWSNSRSFIIDTSSPSSPTLRIPANNTSMRGVPTFRWSAVNGAVQYQFEIDNDSNFSSPLLSVTQRLTYRRPPGMLRGAYYWHVRAQDAAGNWGAWSPTFTLNILPLR
ncbi:MAG TPA: C39 family peptidase [Anaerolineales bacterium]|nr:C39 family peptidase [Anaerolineales bacterium]